MTAYETRWGLLAPMAPLRAQLGEPKFKKLLAAFTIREKPIPGRPAHMCHGVVHAYRKLKIEIDGKQTDCVCFPRAKTTALLEKRIVERVQTLHDLPPPRAVAAERREAAIELFPYQKAIVKHLCGGEDAESRRASVFGRAGVEGAAHYQQMATGLGKTVTAVAVAAALGVPAVVVVPTKEIAQQWVDDTKMAFPKMLCAIYNNQQNRNKVRKPPTPKTHDVVVVIVNTFRDKEPEFLEGAGLVVYDEANEYCSKENSKVLWLAQTRYALAMSATPLERPDGLDRAVCKFVGEPLPQGNVPGFALDDVKYRGEVWKVEYSGHPDHAESVTTAGGTTSAVLTIARFYEDPHRMALVSHYARLLHDMHLGRDAAANGLHPGGSGPLRRVVLGVTNVTSGAVTRAGFKMLDPALWEIVFAYAEEPVRRHGVFIFAEHREVLISIRDHLAREMKGVEIYCPELEENGAPSQKTTAKKVSAVKRATDEKASDGPLALEDVKLGARPTPAEFSVLRGNVSREERARARTIGAHIILTTYGYSRRGVSIKEMTCAIRVSPRRNGSTQFAGRITRRGSDQRIRRVIVDIVDMRTSLKNQFTERKKAYAALGWEEFQIKKIKHKYTDFKVAEPAKVAPASDSVTPSAAQSAAHGISAAQSASQSDSVTPDFADDASDDDATRRTVDAELFYSDE